MKKSASYRETFRQHRWLLSVPIVVAVVIAGWFALGAPKSYPSTTSLWVDNPASPTTTLDGTNPATTPPSQQERNVVTELLSTNAFVLAVAHHSSLAAYLAANPSAGWGPTALLSKLGGGGSLKSRILAALSPKQVTTATPGPQVLDINYAGPTPSVAQSTLQAIVKELQVYNARFTAAHNQAAAVVYNGQVQAASRALATARDRKDTYRRQHPRATSSDPTLNTLTAAVATAQANLTQANANLSQAHSGPNGGSPVQVVDSASFPLGPASGKKKALEGILGGLFAGLIISFLGVIALTRRKSDPWEDERELFAEGTPQNGQSHEPASGTTAVATPRSKQSTLVAGKLSVSGTRSVPRPGAAGD